MAVLAARVAKLRIRAPTDGTVALLVAEPGEAIIPGQPVMTLETAGERWASFNLREDQLDDLHIGSPVELLPLADGDRIAARVAEIIPRGEFATWRAARAVGDHDLNTFVLRADPVGPASASLQPGMTVWLEPKATPLSNIKPNDQGCRDAAQSGSFDRLLGDPSQMYQNAAFLAVFLLIYSAVAGRVERSLISGPIVFTAIGFILGADGLGVLRINITGEGLRLLAELTLAMVLFTDAANADFGVVRRNLGLPERLLGVGLPLTILLGFLFAAIVFPSLGILEMALLAAILAPTDAALGKPVVTNATVPPVMREALNLESGLNDGICVYRSW